jgi:SAM-dependent methyltransferase
LLTGKADFPPLYLRRYVGPLRTFEMTGAEFRAYLQLLCGLRPESRLLDLGCGCGLMALALRDYFVAPGSYTGVDIHQPSIRWCQRHLAGNGSRLSFVAIDVINRQFNPAGRHAAESYRFPFEGRSFDVILCKSLFTHMRPPEVENYLKEIGRLLAEGGRCLATFFLLGSTSVAPGKPALQFQFGDGVWRYEYEHSPESAVAYFEDYIRKQLDGAGLKLLANVYRGRWSGYREGLSFQDLLVIGRR